MCMKKNKQNVKCSNIQMRGNISPSTCLNDLTMSQQKNNKVYHLI